MRPVCTRYNVMISTHTNAGHWIQRTVANMFTNSQGCPRCCTSVAHCRRNYVRQLAERKLAQPKSLSNALWNADTKLAHDCRLGLTIGDVVRQRNHTRGELPRDCYWRLWCSETLCRIFADKTMCTVLTETAYRPRRIQATTPGMLTCFKYNRQNLRYYSTRSRDCEDSYVGRARLHNMLRRSKLFPIDTRSPVDATKIPFLLCLVLLIGAFWCHMCHKSRHWAILIPSYTNGISFHPIPS